MKTTLKWLAGIAAAAAVLALVAAWLLDSDALEAEIEGRVKNETGLALSISGGVSLSLFPRPGVKVGRSALRNPPGFGDENLAEFEALSLQVKLMPLLGGTMAPDVIAVDGLKVHLLRSASGRHNFDALLAPRNDADGAPPALLLPGRLTLANAALTYADQESGETLRITDLDFRAGLLSASRSAPLTARFQFIDSARGVEGRAALGAELSADPAQRTVNARALTADVVLQKAGMTGGGLQIEASAEARFDAQARLLSLEQVKIAGNGSGLGEGPVEASVPQVAVDLSAGTAKMGNFVLTAVGLDAVGALTASGLGTNPAFSGRVTVASFSPAHLMARLGRPLPEPLSAVLADDVRLETSVSGDSDGLILEPVAVTRDGARAAGRIDLGVSPGWPVTTAVVIEGPPVTDRARPRLTLRASGRALEGTATYRVEGLELTLGPAIARGEINLDATGDPPSYTVSLTLDEFDARALLEYLGQPAPKTGDPKAFTRVELGAVLAGGRTHLVLDPLTLRLDDTRVSGSVSVSDMLDPGRAVNVALRADTLDIGRYLPPSDHASDGVVPAPPPGLLPSLNLNARVSLGALIVGDVVVDDFRIEARSSEGRLELQTGSASRASPSSGPVAASAPPALPAP